MSPARAAALLAEIELLPEKAKITAQQTMHVAGILVWAATVVWGGRTFSQPWLTASAHAQHLDGRHSLRINSAMHRSLRWWPQFLCLHNGKRLVLGVVQNRIIIATDATGNGGIGIFIDASRHIGLTGDEVRAIFHDAPLEDAHVFLHESFAVLVALRIFKQYLRDSSLHLITDNPTTARMMRFLSQRDPALHSYAESIFWLAEECNFRFTDVELVPGKFNECADALSRQQYARFYAILATL